MNASVILCGWNSAHYLQECLESLLALRTRPLEILYVDGGSTDGSREVFEQAAARAPGLLRWLEQGSEPGLAHARNVGIAAARGEIISFIDADARAHPEWLERALARFSREPELAGLGGAGLETGDHPADRFRAVYYQQWWGPAPLRRVRFLFGLNSHYRASCLRELGGFDVRFLSSGEDVDLGLRLNARGHRLGYDPEVEVRHGRRDTWATLAHMVDRWSYYGWLAQMVRGRARKGAGFWLGRQVVRPLRWLCTEAPRASRRPPGWWRRPYFYWLENRASWRCERDFALAHEQGPR